MKPFRYTVCDVFTSRPLEGNALAVFPDGPSVPEDRLQQLARELNLSETVFVYPSEFADARIRIFTPATELRFAGHPVLGTANVVGRAGETVRIETGAGVVPVELTAAGGTMRQPVPSVTPVDASTAGAVLDALGVRSSLLPVERYDNGMQHVYVVLAGPADVAALRPDMSALAEFAFGVNTVAGSATAWKTRMFAPGAGVPEDPATGSAAGPLACHLARHQLIVFGDTIEIRQGVEVGRPSLLRAAAFGTSGAIERVEVGGDVVVVARGEFAW